MQRLLILPEFFTCCVFINIAHTQLFCCIWTSLLFQPNNFTFVLKFQETFATLILSVIFIINVDILKRNAFRTFPVFLVKIQTQNYNFIYALLSGHFTLLSRAKLARNFSKCFDQNWFQHIIQMSIETITVIFDYIFTFCDVLILRFRFLWIWYWKYEKFHKKAHHFFNKIKNISLLVVL